MVLHLFTFTLFHLLIFLVVTPINKIPLLFLETLCITYHITSHTSLVAFHGTMYHMSIIILNLWDCSFVESIHGYVLRPFPQTTIN